MKSLLAIYVIITAAWAVSVFLGVQALASDSNQESAPPYFAGAALALAWMIFLAGSITAIANKEKEQS